MAKLLIIESDPTEANKLHSVVSETELEFEINQVRSLSDAFQFLKQEKAEAILLNLMLQDSGGVYTLTRLKKVVETIPILVINGLDDSSLAEKSMEAGALDYIRKKEIGSNRLKAALEDFAPKPVQPQEPDAQPSLELRKELEVEKLAALGQLSNSILGEVSKPIEDLQGFIESIERSKAQGQDLNHVVNQMIENALEASADLRKMIVNLQNFSEELRKDERVQSLMSQPIRFLIVEDEPEIANLVERRLRRMGYEHIEIANDGLEAYNRCIKLLSRRKKIDAIISDWNMPRMNGLQLLERLRENAFYERVPFMMLTALDQKHHVQQAIDLGVNQYLMKPFRQEELEQRVQNLLLGVRAA